MLKEASLFTYLSSVQMIWFWKKICVEYWMYCSFTVLFYRAKCELFVSYTIQDIWSCLQWRRCNWSSTYVCFLCSTIQTLLKSKANKFSIFNIHTRWMTGECFWYIHHLYFCCFSLFVGTGTGKTVSKIYVNNSKRICWVIDSIHKFFYK